MADEEWIKQDKDKNVHIILKSSSLDIDDKFSPFIFIGINPENEAICIAGAPDLETVHKLIMYASLQLTSQFKEIENNGEQE